MRYEVGFGLILLHICSSFPPCMIHMHLKDFSKFQNFCHVTNDAIMGSRDQHSIFFSLKYSQTDFRKSHEGISPHVEGFAIGIIKFTGGGGGWGWGYF